MVGKADYGCRLRQPCATAPDERRIVRGKAEQVALTSLPRPVETNRNDHRRFVQRILDAVARKTRIEPSNLATHHQCRPGRWPDSDDRLTGPAVFNALQNPQHAAKRRGGAGSCTIRATG
jgi:hypothetical protein